MTIYNFLPLLCLLIVSACAKNDLTVHSPDGKIRSEIQLFNGALIYQVYLRDSLLIGTSKLGLEMEDENFSTNLKLESASDVIEVKDEFTLHHGKRKLNTYQANERTFHITNKNGKRMDVVFRLSNDGMAFRYHFPDKSDQLKTISKENTSFHFLEGTKGFLQPMSKAKTGWSRVNPCYEEFYQKDIAVGTPSTLNVGWAYPALFHLNNKWMLITEAGLGRNYCGTRLAHESPNGEYTVAFPEAVENFPGGGVLPQSKLPWSTPWRVIVIGNLATIIESQLGLDLADKAISMDESFVKPGHAAWSWALLKDDSTVFDVQRKFVDYAARMQWEYSLVDADWDKKIGYDKMKELVKYADEKKVGLLLWYNSAGSWNDVTYTPKDKFLTAEARAKEFGLLQQVGVKGVKIDFFGGDGQSMINYYIDLLEDAAKHKLMVNFHGGTLPRGWHRTYPNLYSAEAVKGFEYVTFDQANADEQPSHCAILPYTRNAFDPMDFTPLSLDTIPRINRRTSAGFELALSVVFLSGIQHFVEIPAGMKNVPSDVQDFLKDFPQAWTDTKFISGYPGKDLVIARQSGNKWYVAAINGENKDKNLSIDLDFLNGRNGEIFADSNTHDRVPIAKTALGKINGMTNIRVGPYGGFVMVVE